MLRILTGPMFAGKTTRLIESITKSRPHYDVCTVVKWSQDLRSGSRNSIKTHSGWVLEEDVRAVDTLDDVSMELGPTGKERLLVAVDEAHFFRSDLLRLWDRVQRRNENRSRDEQDLLILSGLDLDFRREKFGHILDLIEQNQGNENVSIEMLAAKCYICGDSAFYSMRTKAISSQVVVGGSEIYRPACDLHHIVPELEDVELAQSQ